jgi:LuxR family transcriptional regulator, quorum-sensing system regulator SolR
MTDHTIHHSILNHVSLKTCREIEEICKPLLTHTPIKVFGYSRVFPDGSRAELSSHAGHLENAFITRAKMKRVYTPDLIPDDQFIFIRQWIENLKHQEQSTLLSQLLSQHELFNIGNELTIVKKHPGFVEYFHFYAASHSPGIEMFYINNLNILEKFTFYFTNQAIKFIEQATKNPIIKPWRLNNIKTINTVNPISPFYKLDKSALLKQIKIKRIYLNTNDQETYLTKREMDCAVLLVQGKTNQDIADNLFISPRTVETHLESLRMKTNCKNRRELIDYLLCLGFKYI